MRRSHARGYRAAWTVYLDLYPRGGHYTTVKAFQVYLREGNRHVRVAQLCFPFNLMLSLGMRTLKNWTTSQQSAYTPPMRIGVMHGPS